MARDVHCFHEVGIAGYAADIFRRTRIRSVQAPRRVQRAFELGSFQERDAMPPAITEVINVFKRGRWAQRFIQANPLLVFQIIMRELGIQLAVVFTVDDELVQMPALPSGVCQCSWNMSHAASSSLCTWITVVSFSGFSQTLPTGCQFRVLPDQRAGC